MVEGDLGRATLSAGLVGYEETRDTRGFGFVSVRGGVAVDAGVVRLGLSLRDRLGQNGPREPVLGLSLDVPVW